MVEEYVVSAAKASGSQESNGPDNVTDGIDSTRWASKGIGEWIELDLGEPKTPVRSVGIMWFRANERTYDFKIETSIDGATFEDALVNGKSIMTPEENLLQRHNFPTDKTGRFVRIIVNGNSQNSWASIRTVQIFSKASISEPGELDEHGIKKIYKDSQRPTKARDWYMGKDDFRNRIARKKWLDDNQGRFETDSQNNVMYVRNKDSDENVRLNVFSTSDPEEETLGANRFSITKKKDSNTDASTKGGFLFKPQDWRDLEITCYIYVSKEGNPNDNYAWYVRGGYQGENDFQKCSSCKYSPRIEYKPGSFSAAKKTEHGTNYDRDSDDDKITIFDGHLGDTRGKWIGYKAVVYNQPPVGNYPQSNNTPIFPVKIEIWTDSVDNEVDENGNFTPRNQWKKKMETMDNPLDNEFGRWGEDDSLCNAPDYVTLSWGGPMVTFRIDRAGGGSPYNNFRLKYASIREIEPGIRT